MQGTSRNGEGGKESAIVINYYVTPDGSELRLDLVVLLIAWREKITGEKILVVINGMASGGKRKKKWVVVYILLKDYNMPRLLLQQCCAHTFTASSCIIPPPPSLLRSIILRSIDYWDRNSSWFWDKILHLNKPAGPVRLRIYIYAYYIDRSFELPRLRVYSSSCSNIRIFLWKALSGRKDGRWTPTHYFTPDSWQHTASTGSLTPSFPPDTRTYVIAAEMVWKRRFGKLRFRFVEMPTIIYIRTRMLFLLALVPCFLLFVFLFFSCFFLYPGTYVYLLGVPSSVQQPSATLSKYVFYSACSFCLCHS